MPGHIGWKDIHRHYLGANKALLELKSLKSLSEITGRTDEELSPASSEDNRMYLEQDLRVLKGEKISSVHKDSNSNAILLLDKSPIRDEHNTVVGLIYYCRYWHKADVFNVLSQLDDRLNLETEDYSVDYHNNPFKLTSRESECLFLLIRGKTAKEIASLLSLSKRTIESYIENMKNKMNCQNKAEILVKAVTNDYHKHIPAGLNSLSLMNSL